MDASYQHFHEDSEDEFGETSHESNVKIHIPPASQETRWSHIEDLDLFFSRIYTYHRENGFFCILLHGVLELIKGIFMLVFCVFLIYFVDYQVLFRNKLPPSFNATLGTQKVTIPDVVCPLQECFKNISGLAWFCITIFLVCGLFRLIKLVGNLYHFWDIKGFFNFALQIQDKDLSNTTWNEVQKKICEVQPKHRMCIRKETLTELDIYHRILRTENYMVAMINKSILPMEYNIPLLGKVLFMSQSLKYNIELLLFSQIWGFFENWDLKADYKKKDKRLELAAKLQRNILLFALGNLILGVFIFVWQLVYFLFNYAELLKREPAVLALRCWSLYGRLYLRHFNELEHELEARLKRAYRPASKYMNTFSSPITIMVAQYVTFTAGSMFIVIACLAIYDEDVLTVEHILTIMTLLGIIVAMTRSLIPDENVYYCPETLMIEILAEVHYLPDNWRGQAFSTSVRDQFSDLFQYKAVYLLFELVSPVVTPLILYFKLMPRSQEIIDFYRYYTVHVTGVGDVCSFSLMDMRKHGNPNWQAHGQLKCPVNNKQQQAEDGKTELSLMHFAAMNPTWHPPQEAEQFIHQVQENARHQEPEDRVDRHLEALQVVSNELSMFASQYPLTSKMNFRHGYKKDGAGTSSSYYFNRSGNSDSMLRHQDNSTVDMSINALYLHTLHHRKLAVHPSEQNLGTLSLQSPSVNTYTAIAASGSRNPQTNICEGTPLLKNVHRLS